MRSTNDEQSEFWEQLAPDWLASEEHTELVSGRFGESAMARLALTAGARVLDVGCGSGSTTIELARRVEPEGAALGVDIAPTMVEAARRHAASLGVANVSFAVADAQTEPFETGSFDAVFSRFGVMFFADPVAALANIRSALRTEGELAFACWQQIFANEWMLVPGMALVEVTGSLPPMPGPGEPGPFSMADPDQLRSVLVDAGFTQIEITPQTETIVLQGPRIESLVELSRRVGPVREVLRTADAETATRVVDAVRAALLGRVEAGTLQLGAAALVVSARA
jgi:SAM-dependent methyltransferase